MNKEEYKYQLIEQLKTNPVMLKIFLLERDKRLWKSLGCMFCKNKTFVNSEFGLKIETRRIASEDKDYDIELKFEEVENADDRSLYPIEMDLTQEHCISYPIYFEDIVFKESEISLCYVGFRLDKRDNVYEVVKVDAFTKISYLPHTNQILTTGHPDGELIWDDDYHDLEQAAIFTKKEFSQKDIDSVRLNLKDVMSKDDQDEMINICLEANQKTSRPTISILLDWLRIYQVKMKMKGS